MRISIIVHGRFWAFDLAREFEKAGHLHQLITTHPRFMARRFGIPAEKVVSLVGFEAGRRLFRKVIKNEAANNWLETFISRTFARQAAQLLEPCDVLLAWSSVGTPAFKKAHAWGTLCISERGSSHILEQGHLLKEEYALQGFPWVEWTQAKRQLELDDYHYADVIDVPSIFAKKSFIRHNVPENRLLHVPYGADLSHFYAKPPPAEKPFRILFVGTLSLRKGVGYLERAFLEADLPDSELWFVGPAAEETPRLLTSKDSRIRVLGSFPEAELADIYAQGDVFVMPSIEDGFGLVLAQALACGLPIIATTNTGAEDLLTMSEGEALQLGDDILQYPAGFIVPIRRPDCIAFCIRKLQQNPELLTAMRAQALQIATKEFGWSHRAAEQLQHYERLLNQKRATSPA